MDKYEENKKVFLEILEECNQKLENIDIVLNKYEDITNSLNNISDEVEKIRRRLSNMKKHTKEGKDVLSKNKERLNDVLISINLDNNLFIKELIIANLPDGIYSQNSDVVRSGNKAYNTMYNEEVEEKIENTNELMNTIFLFESTYKATGKRKGMEYICIGKIEIMSKELLNSSYLVSIIINDKVKVVKKEYKNVDLTIDNKLEIYTIINRLNDILYYGK